MKKLDFDFLYAKFGLLWNKNASFICFLEIIYYFCTIK